MTFRNKKIYCPKYNRDRGGKYIDVRECYACLHLASVNTDNIQCWYGPSKPLPL